VAGSNYEVNIQLNVKRINQQLNNLERRIKKLNDIAMGQKGVGKAALKTERDKLALATKTFRREQQITKEKAKQNKLENNTAKITKKAGVRPTSKIPLGPSSPLNFDSQGRLRPGRAKTKGDGVLSGALISGAFPLLFGQGPLGAAAGFGGGLIGGKLGGQTGGFAGGLIATGLLTQIQQISQNLTELGKSMDMFGFSVATVSKALGVSGTPTEEYLKVLEQTQGKQAAFNESMRRMEELVGQDGVEALRKFSEGTRELQSSISRFLTQIGAQAAKLFTGGSGRVTGLRRSQLLGDARQSTDPDVAALVAERGSASRKRKAEIDEEIIALMLGLETNKKNLDIEETRLMKLKEMTKSVTNRNLFLQESLQLGTREAEIQEKLRELDRQAEKQGIKILDTERDRFENSLRLQQELERVNSLYQGIADTVQSGLVDAIEGAINGTKTLGDVARSVFGAIQRQLINFAATSFLRAIPGIGGFFANGGRPPVGKPSIVGERGPELFVPNSAGTIIPNHELGGMGGSTNIVVNVDASGSAVEGDEAEGRELGRLISVAVQSEIIQQQRPGGLLA
tara:strand:+ start:431 stop:2137 length:1707 start_codon:yes stop_codon:yes gene_type:complete